MYLVCNTLAIVVAQVVNWDDRLQTVQWVNATTNSGERTEKSPAKRKVNNTLLKKSNEKSKITFLTKRHKKKEKKHTVI